MGFKSVASPWLAAEEADAARDEVPSTRDAQFNSRFACAIGPPVALLRVTVRWRGSNCG
jgi:hypothetical protein